MKQNYFFIIIAMITFQSLFSQSVGIGTANIDPTAKLQVEATNQGFLPPRLTTVERNAIVNPAEGLQIYNLTTHCLEYWNASNWVSTCQTNAPLCYQNCNAIKLANPSSSDGIYTIDVDCGGPIAPMQCYCDMTTDGGGWTLVLNYLHQGGTNPNLNIRSTDLPLLNSTTLGINESGTQYWGHASNSLMNSLSFTTIRFYGKTNNHARVLHFKTSHANTISYFKTGIGNAIGIESSFIALTGHTAFLPANTNNHTGNQGNIAMCTEPYYYQNTYHWNLKWGGNRWEVDNFYGTWAGNTGYFYHTYHQIWVK